MEKLLDAYKRILQEVDVRSFNLSEDKYSGVFLPVPFEEYWHSPVKIMLVGRETAGWNTLNGKNTMSRVLGLVPDVTEFVDGKKVNPTIALIDWEHPENNQFHFTEEFTVLRSGGVET
ncbi:type I restriction endonuclease, partial [Klebsiella pneumoniae]|uniref:type I restriction endonuclease n=1 Tax=Klebsiella pneumoniae TaxID=573 RepID=UPI003EDF5EB3